MAERAAVAFALAALLVLALGWVMRSWARRARHPWVRQAGGVVLLVAAPVGLVLSVSIPTRALAVVGGAVALALLGLVRDRVGVPRWLVASILVAVAVAVTASGLRFPLGGVPAVDFAWTVAWLVCVTLAIANSGNADGQFPSLAAASAFGVFGVAAFERQVSLAMLAAALVGSLVAFLAYNLRPASLYAGRVGTLFCGFMIAAGAVWARPSIGRPDSLVVSVLLVGVVLLDGMIVVVSRLRRRRRLTVRIRDHVSHRLVAAGLRPSRTIQLLTLVQLALSIVAVFVARGVMPIWLGALAGGVLLFVLGVLAMRARMRDVGGVPGLSWRVRLLLFGLLVFVVTASAIAGVSALSSRHKLLAARDAANSAIRAANAGDSAQAMRLFAQAERDFADADDRLGSIVNVPSLVVPVVGSNMHAARELTRVGLELSRAGTQLTQQINSEQLHMVDGRIPLESVAAIAPELDDAAQVLVKSDERIDRLSRNYLVGELADGVRQLQGDLTGAARNATTAAQAARVAPSLLGGDQPRRYLLLIQNPAEVRGTGGLVGNWGVLTAQNGTIELASIERLGTFNAAARKVGAKLHAPQDYVDRYAFYDPAQTSQNANMTPDFPTAAAVYADVYKQSFGSEVDGVLGMDPLGLKALLELTGPVRVADWRTPISADNVVDVTLRDAYATFARTPDRADFLGDVARAAIDRATAGDLGSLEKLSRVLGRSAHDGHFALWLVDGHGQHVVDEIGVGGHLSLPRGDSLHVTNTNASANKLDYYLDRAIDYSVEVTPSSDLRDATVNGTASVQMHNTAPTSGLPQIVAGPFEGALDEFVYGQNRTFVSVYSPLNMTDTRVGDDAQQFDVARELGRNVTSRFIDVFAQQSKTFDVDISGSVALSDGWYELTVFRQPTLRPDAVTVRVTVPAGYRILKAPGMSVENGVAGASVSLEHTQTFRVKIGAAPSANLWDRLQAGS